MICGDCIWLYDFYIYIYIYGVYRWTQ
jgi:hypothetical protein